MAGTLYHSPQRIVHQLLLDLGLASDPQDPFLTDDNYLPWPAFKGREPDRPDEIVKVSGTVGTDDGDCMDGEHQEHHGIQIMTRSYDDDRGHYKCREIAVALDHVDGVTVVVQDDSSPALATGTGGAIATYVVAALKRTSGPIPIGPDTPQGKRLLFTVNFIAAIRLCSIS